MPERFSGRLWHALKRLLGPEVVSLIAQALAGPGIRLHWDILTDPRCARCGPSSRPAAFQKISSSSMATTMGLSFTLGISVLSTVTTAAAAILHRSRTAKPSSSDRARPTTAASCNTGGCMHAGVFASKFRHRCCGSTSPLMTAPEPTHTWLSRAVMWWSGLTLWLALLFSCFFEPGLP